MDNERGKIMGYGQARQGMDKLRGYNRKDAEYNRISIWNHMQKLLDIKDKAG
jgi:hypothetical protein